VYALGKICEKRLLPATEKLQSPLPFREYSLRLADFIVSEKELILQEWEAFARTLKPAAVDMTQKELRDHAALLLTFIAKDISTSQSADQQAEKSRGEEDEKNKDCGHGIARLESNFTIEQLVSEYRALRSSVLRLWTKSQSLTCATDIEDIIRFDEAIDQLLAASVFSFAEAKRRVEEAEKDRRSNFLAMLGHELRNPLSPISSAATILKKADRDSPVIDKVSDIISRQVSHMAGLIDDLLDVSRVTRGMIEIKLEVVDLKQVIEHAVEQVEPQIQARRQKLLVTTPPEPAIVQVDKKRIVQIITNLLANATKYTPEEGHVQLKVKLRQNDVIISIEDNGAGMAPDFIPQAFELFAQAVRTPDRAEGGLGLGLALVKNLVELHGGQVSCSSEGLGKGSQFTVRLPRQRLEDPAS
jgi:signal transduction histidine kinase